MTAPRVARIPAWWASMTGQPATALLDLLTEVERQGALLNDMNAVTAIWREMQRQKPVVVDNPRRVILESPYGSADRLTVQMNVRYARACVRDSVLRGEAPLASHLLYTQPGILDDRDPTERAIGIAAGLAWRNHAEATIAYTDRGISEGMERGIALAREAGIPIEFRQIGNGWRGRRWWLR